MICIILQLDIYVKPKLEKTDLVRAYPESLLALKYLWEILLWNLHLTNMLYWWCMFLWICGIIWRDISDVNISERRVFVKIKGLQLTDILIIVLMSAVIGLDMDFAKLDTIDYVCLGAFAFWLLALVARLYIANRKD